MRFAYGPEVVPDALIVPGALPVEAVAERLNVLVPIGSLLELKETGKGGKG